MLKRHFFHQSISADLIGRPVKISRRIRNDHKLADRECLFPGDLSIKIQVFKVKEKRHPLSILKTGE